MKQWGNNLQARFQGYIFGFIYIYIYIYIYIPTYFKHNWKWYRESRRDSDNQTLRSIMKFILWQATHHWWKSEVLYVWKYLKNLVFFAVLSDTRLMTFHTIITNTSSCSWISQQQGLQPHMEIFHVSKYLAHQTYSIKGYRSLHNIFIDYPENIIHFGIRTMKWITFSFVPAILLLKAASKTRKFQLFFLFIQNVFTILHWKRGLTYIPCQPHVPQLTQPQVWHVIQYTNRQT